LELLPELDFKISQVDSAVRIICPETILTESQTDDHDLKRFKRFRLIELKGLFDQLLEDICVFLKSASEHVELMQLSSGGLFEEYDDEAHLQATSEQTFHWVNCMIKLLKRSELDIAEDCRQPSVAAIDVLFEDTFNIVAPNAPKVIFLQSRLTRPPIIELTLLTLPILKLFKLFFKKLSKDGLNNKKSLNLPSFTQMNSNQLESLSQSARKILADLSEIMRFLMEADLMAAAWPPIDYRSIIKMAERLPTHFEPTLLSVVLYLIPLINHQSDQKYYQTWFVTWNILINTAIHNFLRLARSLIEQP
jgi:hypothetical protein